MLGQWAASEPFSFGKKCAVVTDSTVGPLYAHTVLASLSESGFSPTLITVPAGENSKSMAVAENICEQMISAGLDRKSWVIALGGGVVGDLAGFVAAIYYRGIPFVQLPTTIISQVDSAVGGKTGVNTRLGKNLIGAFHQPRLVIADVQTLQTLPPREFNEGFAEIIKHGAIRDASLLDSICVPNLQTSPEPLAEIIRRNVEIKANIVAADEYETTGLRALLNFGHTIGHGIENAAGYGKYLHGEAISLGLVAALDLSKQKASLTEADAQKVLACLDFYALPKKLPVEIPPQTIIDALKTDKKFAAGEIRFVLVPRLGDAFISKEITQAELLKAIENLY
jgi:3-dehydroquinate synthase